MSELLPKDIAAWHRLEAKKHQELANFHKKTADTIEYPAAEIVRYRRVEKPQEPKVLTLEQFEKALNEKGGRVNHIAARLGVGEEAIWDLINDPNSKFEIGNRGFIYPKK